MRRYFASFISLLALGLIGWLLYVTSSVSYYVGSTRPMVYKTIGQDGRMLAVVTLSKGRVINMYAEPKSRQEEYVLSKLQGTQGTHIVGNLWNVDQTWLGWRVLPEGAVPYLVESETLKRIASASVTDKNSAFPPVGKRSNPTVWLLHSDWLEFSDMRLSKDPLFDTFIFDLQDALEGDEITDLEGLRKMLGEQGDLDYLRGPIGLRETVLESADLNEARSELIRRAIDWADDLTKERKAAVDLAFDSPDRGAKFSELYARAEAAWREKAISAVNEYFDGVKLGVLAKEELEDAYQQSRREADREYLSTLGSARAHGFTEKELGRYVITKSRLPGNALSPSGETPARQ